MLIPRRLGLGCALFLSTGAFSQGLGLDSLIRMGVRGNPDLLLSQEESESLAGDTLAATIPVNPRLELEAAYNPSDPGRPKASVRISREYRPGVRKELYRASKAGLESGRQQQRSRELETTVEIRSAYYAWQILNRKAMLQSEVQKRWEGLSRIATAKVKEGRLSQVEETQARLNLAMARQRELGIRMEMASLEKRLAYLTGQPSLPESPAPIPIESSPTVPSLDSVVDMAIRESPDLKALDQEVAARRARESLEKARGNPSMNFSLGYERETEGDNLIGAGVELPLPLFDRNQAGIARARSDLKIGGQRRAIAEQRLRVQLAEIHGRLGSLAERYRSYKQEIGELGLRQLELSEKGFLQGMVGIFDLSKVQEEFLSHEGEALEILEEYYRQWNRLGMAVGGKTW